MLSLAGRDAHAAAQAGSVRFAVIGDNGTGGKEQYAVAQQMAFYQRWTKFDFVIMLAITSTAAKAQTR